MSSTSMPTIVLRWPPGCHASSAHQVPRHATRAHRGTAASYTGGRPQRLVDPGQNLAVVCTDSRMRSIAVKRNWPTIITTGNGGLPASARTATLRAFNAGRLGFPDTALCRLLRPRQRGSERLMDGAHCSGERAQCIAQRRRRCGRWPMNRVSKNHATVTAAVDSTTSNHRFVDGRRRCAASSPNSCRFLLPLVCDRLQSDQGAV